jgi:hypothetical protein
MDGMTRMQYSPISLVRKTVREDIMPSSSGEPLDALQPFPKHDRESFVVRERPERWKQKVISSGNFQLVLSKCPKLISPRVIAGVKASTNVNVLGSGHQPLV